MQGRERLSCQGDMLVDTKFMLFVLLFNHVQESKG